jgi:hypothetical protein
MLWHSVEMTSVAHLPIPDQAKSPSESDRVVAFANAIKTMMDSLPLGEREQVLRRLTEMLKSETAPKAGDVLSVIVRLLPKKRDWTVQDLKNRVAEHGVEASQKEIYNAVGYLTRKGRMRRVGYGQYVVDGVQLTTADEFGGPPLYPASEHGD